MLLEKYFGRNPAGSHTFTIRSGSARLKTQCPDPSVSGNYWFVATGCNPVPFGDEEFNSLGADLGVYCGFEFRRSVFGRMRRLIGKAAPLISRSQQVVYSALGRGPWGYRIVAITVALHASDLVSITSTSTTPRLRG